MVRAEMVLEIDRLKRNAREAEDTLRRVGRTGAASAAQMNAGWGVRSAFGGRSVRIREVSDVRGELEGLGRAGMMVQQIAAPPLGWLARTLSGIALAGGAAGTAITGMVAVDAVKQAAAFERSSLEIERFAESAAMARQILEEIDALAIRTPFETSSIEQVTKGLLTAGVEASRVMEVVTDLAAVASDDETLGRLGGALGVGFAAQKFELERVKQFLEAQVNLVPELANVLGTDNAGVFDAISAGKVGFDEMTAAIKRMSAEGGQFYGLMEARSKDLSGQWSTLMGNVDLLLRRLGQPSMGPLTEAVDQLNNERFPALVTLAEEFGQKLRGASEVLLGIVVAGEKIDWSGMWANFTTMGLAAGHLVAKGIGEEIGMALNKMTGEGPGSGLFGALKAFDRMVRPNVYSTEEERKAAADAEAARKRFRAAADRDVARGGEFGAQFRQEVRRGDGESPAAFRTRALETQDDRGWYSAETARLRDEMLAAERALEAIRTGGPTTGGRRLGLAGLADSFNPSLSNIQGEGAQEFVRQWFEELKGNLRVAGTYGKAAMGAPSPEQGPEYGPGNAAGVEALARERLAETNRLVAAAETRALAAAGGAADLLPSSGAAAEQGRYAVSGSLRSIVNQISGRGGAELLYVEASRQTELLGNMDRTLREIRTEMTRPVSVPVTAPGRFVE